MNPIATGGLAFPFNAGEHGIEPSPGMTLRDWLAGQAMPAIIAAISAGQHTSAHPGSAVQQIAADSYEVADAMIAQRDRIPF